MADPEVFYCELADIPLDQDKIISLCAEKDDSDILNQENFDGCRRDARSLIDGYAMTRYSKMIPFNPIPAIVKKIAKSLSKYFLYGRKNQVDEDLRKEYDAQIELLEGIQDGTIKLEQDDQPVAEDSIQFTKKTDEDRVFFNLPGYMP